MTPVQLDTLNDDGLRDVIAAATDLLATRDRERKERAMREAGELLASVGLSLRPDAVKVATARPKRRAAASYRAGHVYQHPDDQALVWKGTGVRPAWLKRLEAAGRRPIEQQPERST